MPQPRRPHRMQSQRIASRAPAQTGRQTPLRGHALLQDPLLNKGTAFSREERAQLGLEGLLPDQVEDLALQVQRTWCTFRALSGDLERHAFMESLRRSNLVL